MRNPCLSTVTVGSLLWVLHSACDAQSYNGGQSSCQTWTDLRRTDRSGPEGNWIHGYMVAVFTHEPKLAAHSSEVSDAKIMQWIDSYCVQNPTQSLRVAAQALEANMKKSISPPK
jgi:hypothetical protein